MKYQKVIFVGVHYKKGFTALDSKSNSGRLIDLVIEKIGDIETEKTNIFPTEYLPVPTERWDYSDQFNLEEGTLYIGLGKIVREHLRAIGADFLPAYHPGYPLRKGRRFMFKYVKDLAQAIKNKLDE